LVSTHHFLKLIVGHCVAREPPPPPPRTLQPPPYESPARLRLYREFNQRSVSWLLQFVGERAGGAHATCGAPPSRSLTKVKRFACEMPTGATSSYSLVAKMRISEEYHETFAVPCGLAMSVWLNLFFSVHRKERIIRAFCAPLLSIQCILSVYTLYTL
jgi:hypothetical protein